MPSIAAGPGSLDVFELPRLWVEPALRACRLFNTALDSAFYDVEVLMRELFLRGSLVTTQLVDDARAASLKAAPAWSKLDLSALSNPEGCLVVMDAGHAPHLRRFERVDDFIDWAAVATPVIRTISVTGVGSSALGAASLAWNAAVALEEPVLAIVPGYGVADVVNQALGGWFGFGIHNWLGSLAQETLSRAAPHVARVGHDLMLTTPGRHAEATELAYQTGSPASDVLHGLLQSKLTFTTLIGHSKGALVIDNATRAVDSEITRSLHVVTFGCPIGEETPAAYTQFLGTFDALGQLNAWGHQPDVWLPSHHSTNTHLPLSMPVSTLLRIACAAQIEDDPSSPRRLSAPAASIDAVPQAHEDAVDRTPRS